MVHARLVLFESMARSTGRQQTKHHVTMCVPPTEWMWILAYLSSCLAQLQYVGWWSWLAQALRICNDIA